MCVAIPARIVTLGSPESHSAVVDVEGVRRDVNISLLFDPNDPVKEGEWVLLHVGFALSRIDAEEAERSLEFIRMLGSVYEEEINSLRIESP